MPWSTRIRYFCVGILLTNSIPHVAICITGRRHRTPFGRHSSAFVNVLWGAANVGSGALLLRRPSPTAVTQAEANDWLITLEAGSVCWSLFMVLFEVVQRARQTTPS